MLVKRDQITYSVFWLFPIRAKQHCRGRSRRRVVDRDQCCHHSHCPTKVGVLNGLREYNKSIIIFLNQYDIGLVSRAPHTTDFTSCEFHLKKDQLFII